MNVKITIEATIPYIPDALECAELGMTVEEMTRYLIKEEGHFVGFIEDDWEIISVKEKKNDEQDTNRSL